MEKKKRGEIFFISSNPPHAHKLGETTDGDLARSRNELHQLYLLFARKGAHSTPKPLDLNRIGCIIRILGIGFQIVDIDFGKTGNYKFQFLREIMHLGGRES